MHKPKLFIEFHDLIASKTLKLYKSHSLDEYPDGEIKDALTYGYTSRDILDNSLSVIMNAVIASNKTLFILSRQLLIEYFGRDPNITDRVPSGDQMNKIVGLLTEVGFIERKSEATRNKGKSRRAATYRVIHPLILDYMDARKKTEFR